MNLLNNKSQKCESLIINEITTFMSKEETSANTLNLYYFIGEVIAEQGEKSFIPHLEKILAENFPNLKGFSARNLRRMRDFYETYKNRADLLKLAMNLRWTVNTVILENCESYDEYAFYLKLAISEKLSKLKLIAAIEENIYVQTQDEIAESLQETQNMFKMKVLSWCIDQVKTNTNIFIIRLFRRTFGSDPPFCFKTKPITMSLST